MSFTYAYERPALTVDCVVFGLDLDEGELEVLLIQRDSPPFEGAWALPGGFVTKDEPLQDAARRELFEEAGVRPRYLEQLFTFGGPDRDPRGWTVSVAYFALVKLSDHAPQAATDARDAAWFPVDEVPSLAFDHERILQTAHDRLVGKVRWQPIGIELLPPKFTLRQLRRMYEVLLERPIDKRNFRKKLKQTGILEELDELEQGVAHRAARLYRFDAQAYERLRRSGADFEV